MIKEYMDIAINEAKIAFSQNEVPVGAVLVRDGIVVSKSHNMKRSSNNIMNHAEIVALIEGSKKIGDWRLNGCELFVTLEPCPMCAGAIQQSRIKKIYIGARSNLLSNKNIIADILQNGEFNHQVEIVYLNDYECSKILSDFFENKR